MIGGVTTTIALLCIDRKRSPGEVPRPTWPWCIIIIIIVRVILTIGISVLLLLFLFELPAGAHR